MFSTITLLGTLAQSMYCPWFEIHKKNVLSVIRERYWIIGSRAAVRRSLNICFDCRRRQAPVGKQKRANLPKDRITPDKPPFTYVGVDCFGPFLVCHERSDAKRYGLLFTCLTSCAIHIEVVHSLDTDSFINSMHCFITRRGKPEQMKSNNGGNFVWGRTRKWSHNFIPCTK